MIVNVGMMTSSPGFNPRQAAAHLEGDRAVAHGYAIAPAAISRPFLFEFFDKPACRGNPAGAYTFRDVL